MKTKFSTIDYVILTYMMQSGITLFVLPRLLAENFSYNGWLAIPIISTVILLHVFLIGYTCKKMSRISPLEIIDQSIHKVFRYPIYFVLIGTWALLGCTVGAKYFQTIQMIAFPNTPQYIFKAILAFIAFFILIKGFDNFVKGTVIFFLLTIWILLTIFFVLEDFRINQLTPFIFVGDINLIDGTFDVIKAFLGLELFILFSSYIEKDINITKAIVYGHLFTTFVYTFVSIVAFGFFSFFQLKEINFTVIYMLDYVQLPFLERVDNLIFSFLFMKVTVTVVGYYWAATEVLKQVFSKINEKVLIFLVLTGSFLFSLTIETARDIDMNLDFLAKIALGISIVLPILLLFLRRNKQDDTSEVRDHA